MRVIAGRAFESTSVMIRLVRLDPSKPHWQAAVRALWLLKNQSRWIKRMGLKHDLYQMILARVLRSDAKSSRRQRNLSKWRCSRKIYLLTLSRETEGESGHSISY